MTHDIPSPAQRVKPSADARLASFALGVPFLRTTHHAPRTTLYSSGMDGHLQRQALTAAERAIEALGRKDPGGARSAVATAVERDQVGLFGALADAVHLAAAELEKDGELSEATWNTLADAVGPGPLQGLVESIRE